MTHNELEFISREFNDFYRVKGIKRHKTIVDTPQQNGQIKRMYKTIFDKVRCMFLGVGLPKFLRREAAKNIIYLINKSSPSTINYKPIMEV